MTGPDGLASVRELLEGLRKGMVPRAVRMFAAQGLVPVSRDSLIRIVVILASDGDEEIAARASTTLTGFTLEQFLEVLEVGDLEPVEVDLLARQVPDEHLWARIVRDPRTADETLRWMARVGGESTQDALITNQRRILACLELLQDIRDNPSATPVVLRKVREFEEEFLEKACAWVAADSEVEIPVQGVSIEEEIAALKAIGMQIRGMELGGGEHELARPEEGEPEEIHDAFLRLSRMNTFEKIMQALKGSREERLILVRDRNHLVVRAVMLSPKLGETEVQAIAGMRAASDEALRMIAARPPWLRRYGILRALVFNPKTPPGMATSLLPRLSERDLGILTRDRNVSDAVRSFARQVRAKRR